MLKICQPYLTPQYLIVRRECGGRSERGGGGYNIKQYSVEKGGGEDNIKPCTTGGGGGVKYGRGAGGILNSRERGGGY